jgi:hypothetical protein
VHVYNTHWCSKYNILANALNIVLYALVLRTKNGIDISSRIFKISLPSGTQDNIDSGAYELYKHQCAIKIE